MLLLWEEHYNTYPQKHNNERLSIKVHLKKRKTVKVSQQQCDKYFTCQRWHVFNHTVKYVFV